MNALKGVALVLVGALLVAQGYGMSKAQREIVTQTPVEKQVTTNVHTDGTKGRNAAIGAGLGAAGGLGAGLLLGGIGIATGGVGLAIGIPVMVALGAAEAPWLVPRRGTLQQHRRLPALSRRGRPQFDTSPCIHLGLGGRCWSVVCSLSTSAHCSYGLG